MLCYSPIKYNEYSPACIGYLSETTIEYIDENTINIDGVTYEFDLNTTIWDDVSAQTDSVILKAKRVDSELWLTSLLKNKITII